MKQEYKRYLYVYLAFLFFIFLISPYLGTIEYETIYNITCDNGSVEIFDNETLFVCGQENPLHKYKELDNEFNINLSY